MKTFTHKHAISLFAAFTLAMPTATLAQTAFMKVVAADGTGDYTTIQDALNACPTDGTRTLVFVKKGFYKEQVTIPRNAVVSLIGENRDETIISHDLSHTMGYEDASETSTIFVEANDFYGDNFTTQNTVGPNGGQAECFTVDGDRATLRHVNLKANQDGVRFFTDSRSYLKDCYIEGTVDYIYDSGIAFIDDCTIKQLRGGYIVAPGNCYATVPRATSRELTGQMRIWGLGLFLRGCRLIYDGESVSEGSSYLGRPWGKTNCAAYYINCYMDKHISAAGWQPMSEGTTPYLGEYGSMDIDGNTLDTSGRIDWAMTEDPDHKTPSQYIDKSVVDNLFNMEFVYNLAAEQGVHLSGDYDPLPLVEPAGVPTSFSIAGGELKWDAVEGAAGYILYKNGGYLANITETAYTDTGAQAADVYTLRTVSLTGCLSDEIGGTATGITTLTTKDLGLQTTRYGVYWNETAQAKLYTTGGGLVASHNGKSLDWSAMPKGVYILRLDTADGGTLTRKVVKEK